VLQVAEDRGVIQVEKNTHRGAEQLPGHREEIIFYETDINNELQGFCPIANTRRIGSFPVSTIFLASPCLCSPVSPCES